MDSKNFAERVKAAVPRMRALESNTAPWPLNPEQRRTIVEGVCRLALDRSLPTMVNLRAVEMLVEMVWQNLTGNATQEEQLRIVEYYRELARAG
jgi:hypothetical protein